MSNHKIKIGSIINVYFNLGKDESIEYNVKLLDWLTPLTVIVQRETKEILYLSGWNKIEQVGKRKRF